MSILYIGIEITGDFHLDPLAENNGMCIENINVYLFDKLSRDAFPPYPTKHSKFRKIV